MITKTETDKTTTYEYGHPDKGDWIRITVDEFNPGGGTIESNLKEDLPRDEDDVGYNNACDGLESMLLALACQGFDLSGQAGHDAVQSALDALANNQFEGTIETDTKPVNAVIAALQKKYADADGAELDEDIIDQFSQTASGYNNEGIHSQIEQLVQHMGEEAATERLREVYGY